MKFNGAGWREAAGGLGVGMARKAFGGRTSQRALVQVTLTGLMHYALTLPDRRITLARIH
jgi:hypothetical protein